MVKQKIGNLVLIANCSSVFSEEGKEIGYFDDPDEPGGIDRFMAIVVDRRFDEDHIQHFVKVLPTEPWINRYDAEPRSIGWVREQCTRKIG